MNLKSRLKQFLIISSVSVGLLMVNPAMSNKLEIKITEGCFSVIKAGTECGNADSATAATNNVFASGKFEIWDTLGVSAPGTLATLAAADFKYEASLSLFAENAAGTVLDFGQAASFASFAALSGHDLWLPALGVFQTVVAGGPLVGPGGLFTINFGIADLIFDGDHTSGMFTAWSTGGPFALAALDAFAGGLFGDALPGEGFLPEGPVDFTAGAMLVAIPEPVSLALVGLGIFAMSSIRRNKKVSS